MGIRGLTGWSKVLARSRRAGSGATGLLDRQSATLELLALQAFLCSVGLLGGDHLDETETTRLLGVGVTHDLALLDGTVLGEEASNFFLKKARVNASDEQVGTRIDGTIIVAVAHGLVLDGGAVEGWC